MTTNCPKNPARETGFTLVEFLVAMTVLGFLMTLLFAGLRFGTWAWARGAIHTAGIDEVHRAQGLLRAEIGHAYPLFLAANQTQPRVDFEGKRDSISLLAPLPLAMGGAGRARINIRRVGELGHANLTMAFTPELAWPDSPPAGNESILKDVEGISFDYYGKDSPNAAPDWSDSWANKPSLPQLVRVRVRFADDDIRRWPDLIISPEIAVDAGCLYDSLTKTCRGR